MSKISYSCFADAVSGYEFEKALLESVGQAINKLSADELRLAFFESNQSPVSYENLDGDHQRIAA